MGQAKGKRLAGRMVIIFLIIAAVVFWIVKLHTGISGRRVVASVNGVPITQKMLEKRLLTWKAAPVLDEMVDEELFTELAQKAGVTVSDEEVEARLNFIKKDAIASLPFEELMRLRGFTMKHIRDQIRRRLLIEKTYKKSVVVTDDDIKKVRASHIFIRIERPKNGDPEVTARNEAQARARAEKILSEVRKPGADFAALAKRFSEDKTSRYKGGDIGMFRKSMGASPLTEAAFTLKEGETSGIVSAGYGFHIVKAMQVRSAADMTRQEAEKERESIRNEQMAMNLDRWIEETKDAAKIERHAYK